MMPECGEVLLFALGASFAGAATLAVIPTIEPNRRNYVDRIIYFLWRYCAPAVVFEELMLRLFFGHFYP